MGRKRTACFRCTVIKISCSGGIPCARCSRLSLSCTPTESGFVPEKLPPAQYRRHVEHSRSKSGCLNCRRRKKKCDERSPVCSDCKRLNLICSLGTLIEATQPEDRPQHCSTSPAASDAHLEIGTHSSAGLTHERSTFNAGVEVHGSPSLAEWMSLIDEEVLRPSNKHPDLANSVAFVDLPVPCAETDKEGYAAFLPSTELHTRLGIQPDLILDWRIGERHLLNHYLQSVARALVAVADEENPFLSIVVPLALRDNMVRHALIALSACHLHRLYPQWEEAFLTHRSMALQGLSTRLGEGSTSLIATLLLCLTEICEGSSRKWLLHLHGSYALLSNTNATTDNTTQVNFSVQLYNRLCCMASVTSVHVPPAVNSRLFQPMSGSSHTNPLADAFGDLYNLLPSISRLSVSAVPPNPEDGGKPGADHIETALKDWIMPHQAQPSRLGKEALAAGSAIRWAMTLRLRQVVHGTKTSDHQTRTLVDQVLSSISLIRPGSEIEAYLLFPLFMAGVASVTKANRLTVEYRLTVMETTIGFGNIFVAHRLLDEIWRRSNEGRDVDWEAWMRASYPGLMLM